MKYFALLLATGSLLCAEQFMTGQAARAVIGQPTFTRQEPGTSQTVLGAVGGLALYNGTLFVVDSSRVSSTPQNNRVLLFRDIDSQLPAPKASLPWDGVERCPLCTGFASVVLGQADFTTNTIGVARDKMRTPTSVATDGRYLVVADTDNNRVLIWNSIPSANNQPPDIVIGQPDFNTPAINYGQGSQVNDRGLRGPQGVWIDGQGGLWVADTQNNRVLRWNQIPRENGAPANLVLGAPDMNTFVELDLTQTEVNATARNMLNPVSVTVDPAGRVLVSDLGHNRVLVWNRTPTQNGEPADIALGQPDVASTTEQNAQAANNSRFLCHPPIGVDAEGNPIFRALCEATLNFPRYALSDGSRLFIADAGNNRILVYNRIPTASGEPADVVLGQISERIDQDSEPLRISSSDSLRTPSALAWDGTNLYVSDPFNRRVMVFTLADQELPKTGVRNAASREIFAVGNITFTADPKENDEVTVKIGTGDTAKEYKYKAGANQTIANVIQGLVEAINAGAGDPLVFATPNVVFNQVLLTARASGVAGNDVEFTVTFSEGSQLAGAGSGRLSGGQDAAKIAPGSIVTILGDNLSDEIAVAPEDANPLPSTLGGVEVYFDGIQAPLFFVSRNEIRAQMPWEVNDSYSVNAYVRIRGKDGQVRTTTAIAVPVIPQNPGIFAENTGTDPRPARAFHGSNHATGVISVDGSAKAGDQAIVTIGDDRNYGYSVKEGDTLETIRNALVNEINADPEVEALPSTQFTRIVLRARIPGPEGEGIPYSARASSEAASVILTPLSPALCCANTEGAPVTEENPARPGQLITIYATGLGIVGPDEAKFAVATGWKYSGPAQNQPNAFIDAIAGGKTANVLSAGLVPGMVGVYELRLQLNSDIPTNPQTQITIAQDIFVSNIATFPVVNPNEAVPEE
jgi:hypothetical protein